MNAALNDVTVVVVTHNSAHCLDALVPLLTQCPHIILSDNGSEDGTAHIARQRIPKAVVIEHGVNLGFGAANNRALSQVQTPFVMLLNPDCILQAASLNQLVLEAANYPEAAILAPQLIQPKGQPVVNYRWPSTMWKSRGPKAEGATCVGFVCGAAMLLRMQSFQKVGFFDEDFFLYYEDDDLCLRLFQAQLPMIVLPALEATHINRGSVKGNRPYYSQYLRGFHHAQSKLIFAAKYRGHTHAHKLHRQLVWQTMLTLPFRVLAFSPALIARMWGRLVGALVFRAHLFR